MPRNLVFYTFFSEGYLPHAHVLLSSIYERYPNVRIIACTLDQGAMQIVEHFPNLEIFSFQEVLEKDRSLSKVLVDRGGASAIFSSAASIALEALSQIKSDEILFYLDADTALLSGVELILEELEDSHVGLFPHRFSGLLEPLLKRYGVYNAGAFLIRNSDFGKLFLSNWRELCIDWCEDKLDSGRYSNQGYLGELAIKYPSGVKSLWNSAGNVAPWNSGLGSIEVKNKTMLYRGEQICFFHFHGLVESKTIWEINHLRYGQLLTKSVLKELYVPYISKLVAASKIFGMPLKKSTRFQQSFAAMSMNFALRIISKISGQYIPKRWLRK